MRLGVLTAVTGVLGAGAAWADHPGGLRTAGWSPLTAALVFGGLALITGMLVVVIIALLSGREPPSEPSSDRPEP